MLQKPSSHHSIEAPSPMTSRIGGSAGSPKCSVHRVTPLASIMRSVMLHPPVPAPRGDASTRCASRPLLLGGTEGDDFQLEAVQIRTVRNRPAACPRA